MTTAGRFTGAEARRLLRQARHAALSTHDRETGYPYASLVNFATDLAGLPVIFISALARHTANLKADPRASLLASQLPKSGDVLTGARVTVIGDCAPIAREEIAERYGNHHPAARGYLNFPDFSFWRLNPRLVHAIAGFGRIETIDAKEVFLDQAAVSGFAPLAESAAAHLNQDHADAVNLIATKLLGRAGSDWRVTSIDPDGALLESNGETDRLDFDAPAFASPELRTTFVEMTKLASLM